MKTIHAVCVIACLSVALTFGLGSAYAGPGNGAEFVEFDFPAAIDVGEFVQTSITVRNTGTTTWSHAAGYGLGIIGDSCGLGPAHPRLVIMGGATIAPGETHVFELPFYANGDEGPCEFRFQMVQELVEFFGDPLTIPFYIVGSEIGPFGSITSPNPVSNGRFGTPFVLHDAVAVTEPGTNTVHYYERLDSPPGVGPLLFSNVYALSRPLPHQIHSSDSSGLIFAWNGNWDQMADENTQLDITEVRSATTGQLLAELEFTHPEIDHTYFERSASAAAGRFLIGFEGYAHQGASASGAAFLFDADPASSSFGDLLLTIFDPDSTAGAEFGEAVHLTETRMAIFRRDGRAFLFDGDPASAGFGQVITELDLSNSSGARGEISHANGEILVFYTGIGTATARYLRFSEATGESLGVIPLPRSLDANEQLIGSSHSLFRLPAESRLVLRAYPARTLIYVYLTPSSAQFAPRAISGNTLLFGDTGGEVGGLEQAGRVHFFQLVPPGGNAAKHWAGYR